MRRPLRVAVVLVGFAVSLASCGGDDGSGPGAGDVTSVTVTATVHTLMSIGETTQLTAVGRTSKGETVSGLTFTWSTSNGSVATVSSGGVAMAAGNGTATITATVDGGSASGTTDITVAQAVDQLTLSPQDGSVAVGETLQLSADASDAGGASIQQPTLTWSSSDDAVATVDAAGLVTGEGAGTATITARAASGVEATAPVDVFLPDVQITQDQDLSGEVLADQFSIAPGVTVTMTGDVMIRAAGMVTLEGTLQGDCRALDVQGDTAVTVMGTVSNGCSDLSGGPADLRIAADGELTLEGATVTSSGDMEFTNDPTLTDDDFPAAVGPFSVPDSPEAAGPGVRFTRVSNSTVRYAGGGTGPDPAMDGTDGLDGTDGQNGRTVKFRLRGNAIFAGNTLLWGQDGGRGGDGSETAAQDVDVNGGKGGDGGLIKAYVTGTLNYEGSNNIIRSGAGGRGGHADGVAQPATEGFKAPSAAAHGGEGGMSGLIDIRAGGGINAGSSGALILEVGLPGPGGHANATAADGADAESATKRAQDGGDATAVGGDGGVTPDKQLAKRGNVSGADPVIRGAGDTPLDGGAGGDAKAIAGVGGDGIQVNKNGGDGGQLASTGGKGGDAQLKNLDGDLLGNGGQGGMASFMMGNGGAGWADCKPDQPEEAGGNGGAGGSATGGDGAGGTGLAMGMGGGTELTDAGNGGAGGDGNGPGSGGDKGTMAGVTTIAGPAVVTNSFNDGPDGNPCTPPTQTSLTIHVGEQENTGGVVAIGTQSVPVDGEVDGEPVSGSMNVEAEGDANTHFVAGAGTSNERMGLQGGDNNAWTLDLGSLAVNNFASAVADQVTLCFANTVGVDALTPIRIQFLNALHEAVKEVLVTNPTVQSCATALALDPVVRFVSVHVASGAIIDILAPVVLATLILSP